MKVPRSSKSARSDADCARATTRCGGKSFIADIGASIGNDLCKCAYGVCRLTGRIITKVGDILDEDPPEPVIGGMRACKNHDGNDKSAKRTKGLRRR